MLSATTWPYNIFCWCDTVRRWWEYNMVKLYVLFYFQIWMPHLEQSCICTPTHDHTIVQACGCNSCLLWLCPFHPLPCQKIRTWLLIQTCNMPKQFNASQSNELSSVQLHVMTCIAIPHVYKETVAEVNDPNDHAIGPYPVIAWQANMTKIANWHAHMIFSEKILALKLLMLLLSR